MNFKKRRPKRSCLRTDRGLAETVDKPFLKNIGCVLLLDEHDTKISKLAMLKHRNFGVRRRSTHPYFSKKRLKRTFFRQSPVGLSFELQGALSALKIHASIKSQKACVFRWGYAFRPGQLKFHNSAGAVSRCLAAEWGQKRCLRYLDRVR